MNTMRRSEAGPRDYRARWVGPAALFVGLVSADGRRPATRRRVRRRSTPGCSSRRPGCSDTSRSMASATSGVLKFRVKKGEEPVSDRVGTLNLDLAARLEISVLVLATDIKAPVGIIHDRPSPWPRRPRGRTT